MQTLTGSDAIMAVTKEFVSSARKIRFWRRVFLSAGIIGLAELAPLYFAEAGLNIAGPPALTHPEFYYGFIGVALAWQLAFIVMARDPARYRPLIPAAVTEKLLYIASTFALYAIGRLHGPGSLVGATIDLGWLALFAIAAVRTRNLEEELSRALGRVSAWRPDFYRRAPRRYGW